MAPGTDAYVTVAAVDVGILNLTGYKPPDPEAWFFGQRMLGIELRDLYGKLIDGSLGVTGKLRTGGDGSGMTAQGNPPTEKLVAFFTGPVKLDADGKASVDFDLPAVQRHGARHGRRLDQGSRRPRHDGRHRARSGRGDRRPAPLPGARRHGHHASRHRQHGRAGRRLRADARHDAPGFDGRRPREGHAHRAASARR